MITAYLKLCLIVVIVGTMTSCSKLIEIPESPVGNVSRDHLFQDSSDVMSAIAGVYLNYNVTGNVQNIFSGTLTTTMGMAVGELTSSIGTHSFQTNAYVSTDGTVKTLWASAYQNIYYINDCLSGISGTSALSTNKKTSLIAELKFNRAMNYFYLLNLYGGVPVVTSTRYEDNQQLARSSVDEVYKFIIADLSEARQQLSAQYPSAGKARPNKYAAAALLSRVYLYQKNYKEASDVATEVIGSNVYRLIALNDVFKQGSIEALWQLPAVGTTSQTAEASDLVPASIFSQPRYPLTSYALAGFEPADLRSQNWIGTLTLSGTTYKYANKYKQVSATATPADGYVMLRVSELYLIRAEAYAQQGLLEQALKDLDAIRLRAGLKASTARSKDEILIAIRNENKSEFFCEWGHEWFDLKRLGLTNSVLSTIKPNWNPNATLLPIPYNDLQNDPNLVQNPGY